MTLTEAIEFGMPCVDLAQDAEWCEFALEIMKKYQELISDNVQPRLKGHWINTDKYYIGWKCSECGCHTIDTMPHFCPNCGAKMEIETLD